MDLKISKSILIYSRVMRMPLNIEEIVQKEVEILF